MNSKRVVFAIISTSLRIIVFALIVMVVYKTSIKAYDFGFRIFAEPAISADGGADVQVTIPMGKSTVEVGEILENKGLIRDANLFYFQEKISAYRGKLQPGFYTLNTSMTAFDLMSVMAESKDETEQEQEDTKQ